MRGLPLLIVALVTAGCVTPEPELPDAGDGIDIVRSFIDPIVDDHDHANGAEHAFTTASMEELGFNVLGDDGKPFSYIGEIDYQGDHAYVAVIGRGSVPGFVIVDVSDATAPVVVGRAEMPNAYVVDVKVDDAGEFVYAASQSSFTGSAIAGLDDALGRSGVRVWDVRDKTAPKLVSSTPMQTGGCHMLSYWQHGGKENLACVGDTIVFFNTMTDATGAKRLVPAGQYAPQSAAGLDETLSSREAAPGPFPHDETFQFDPVTGAPILFVSYWDLGLRIVDVSDVANPVEIGTWTGAGATHYSGNVHSAMAAVVDGKRYIVVGPELLSATQIPSLYILDADDLSAPTLVAEWWAPGDHASQGLLLTTHQFQLVDGRIYIALNHAGLWVLDLATILAGEYREDASRPEVLGYHLARHTEVVGADNTHPIPNTWDVVVRNGVIWATDRYTGLYALHYLPDEIGNPDLSSFA